MRHERPPQLQGTATLLHKERLTPKLLRLHFHAPALAAMAIHKPAHALHVWLGDNTHDKSLRRVFTLRQFAPAQGTLAIDLLLHPQGLASDWALQAQPGATLLMAGPRSGYAWPPHATWLLALVDTCALPALATLIEHAPPERAIVVLPVLDDASDLIYLQALQARHPGLRLLPVCHPADSETQRQRLDSLHASNSLPPGPGAAFIAGETNWVALVRAQLESRPSWSHTAIHASGYWQHGQTGFRHSPGPSGQN